MSENNELLFEVEPIEDEGTNPIIEYDITSSPRDLTPASIVDMIESKIIEIPFFQRNYVWDIKKASKLIESLILGLPVPELFFYSVGDENSTYKIIDGQQRLLSIYLFIKGRFPKNNDARILLGRKINNSEDLVSFFADNKYFQDFDLQLNSQEGESCRYQGLKYQTLDKDTQIKFRLRRYLRTVVVRQNKPNDNDSSMFEIFNRLNTGGTALNNQEIRASLYYCDFYEMITALNEENSWRALLNKPCNDLHSNDIELILRAIALLVDGNAYSPKMADFLNVFSNKSKTFSNNDIVYLRNLFLAFCDACTDLGEKAFFRNNRFSKPFFESVFVASCLPAYKNLNCEIGIIEKESFEQLKNDETFIKYMQSGSSSSESVYNRLNRAISILKTIN